MKKLSHKEICKMGEMMDGIKLNCNIYTFENAENYISRLEPFDEKSGVCCHKVNEIIQEIKKEFPDAKGCQVDSEYYAAGIYGCIGRLSKVTVLDSEDCSFWCAKGCVHRASCHSKAPIYLRSIHGYTCQGLSFYALCPL